MGEADHGFLPKKIVDKIADAFGITISTYTARSNPEEFKGLSLWDEEGNPVDFLEGQDADRVAEQVCSGLDIPYPAMHGRGSQLAVCVDALRKHWTEKIAN